MKRSGAGCICLANLPPDYARALLLGQDRYQRAVTLANIKLSDGSALVDHVDNNPLEILGAYIAYPVSDLAWMRSVQEVLRQGEQPDLAVLDERLITLPTRGIFGEAKLGNCNASAVIDKNRFWDWQQSPIPHMAPEIAAVQTLGLVSSGEEVSTLAFPRNRTLFVSEFQSNHKRFFHLL